MAKKKSIDYGAIVQELARLHPKAMQNRSSLERLGPFNSVIQYDDLLATVVTLAGLKDIESVEDRRKILSEAVAHVVSLDTLTEGALANQIAAREKAFLAQPNKSFTLLTSWSARMPRRTIRLDGASITFQPSQTTTLRAEQASIRHKVPIHLPEPPTGWRYIRISVRGRSSAEAGERAIASLNVVRGIWNYRRHQRRRAHASLEGEPQSDLRIGPIHTIHNAKGALANERFWYEPDFRASPGVAIFDQELDAHLAFERVVRRRLSHSCPSYRTFLRQMFTRYNEGLDTPNAELGLLRFWALLEFLTGSSSHEKVIYRTSFLMQDPKYHEQVLRGICYERNAVAHEAATSGLKRQFLDLAKSYSEHLIEFHLRCCPKFAEPSESVALLDSPKGQEEAAVALEKAQADTVRLREALRIAEQRRS